MPIMIPFYLPQDITFSEKNKRLEKIESMGIPIIFELPPIAYFLTIAQDKIVLTNGKKEKVYVDFVEGSLNHRRRFSGKEMIANAVNIKENKIIWDATAGLGRDAFVLASLDADVYLFERNKVVALLLLDGMRRALNCKSTASIIQKMTLTIGSINSQNSLPKPQAIVLDPMFPERQKTSLVKKEMRFLSAIVGDDKDAPSLLHCARQFPAQRIVVKRPRISETINDEKPAYQYIGKSTRFDVYMPY